jgi:sugar O-acyltransferase (sialic acid O-acetyltransferase NeuD family)
MSRRARPLGLVGAGGHAREVWAIARASKRQVLFFSEDDAPKGKTIYGTKVLDIEALHSLKDRVDLVLAVGSPLGRRKLAERLRTFRFANLVHPQACVGPGVTFGYGCVVGPLAVITAEVTIGNHVLINTGAVVSHQCRLGDFTTCSPNSTLGGGVVLEEGSFVAIGATIANGISIAAGTVVAAGAVVLRDIDEPLTMVAGVPAIRRKKLRSWAVRV